MLVPRSLPPAPVAVTPAPCAAAAPCIAAAAGVARALDVVGVAVDRGAVVGVGGEGVGEEVAEWEGVRVGVESLES